MNLRTTGLGGADSTPYWAFADQLEPADVAARLARQYGRNPAALEKILDALKKNASSEKDRELASILELLIEAAKSGNLSAFTNSLGGGGALRNLANGLSGGRNFGGAFGNRSGGVDPRNLRPWTQEDRDFLDKALISEPEQLRDQISSWRQGQEGNCAMVATIKAAVDRYDANVFDSVQATSNGYRVRMQDGFELSLSHQELSMAKAASNFRGTDGPAKSYAQLSYAAAAKRAQLSGHEGARSFADGLWSLNNGDNPWDSARLLGLSNMTVPVNASTLNGQDAVVAWSHRHAVFVNKNRDGTYLADHYGQARWFNGSDTNGWSLIGAFTLKPRADRAAVAGNTLRDLGSRTPDIRVLGADAWRLQRSDPLRG